MNAEVKPKIIHSNIAKDNVYLIEQIDAAGGWPLTAKSLVMRHGDERDCYFSAKADVRDGWNTSVLSADEYYDSKVSAEFKAKVKVKTIRSFLYGVMPS